MIYPQFKPHEYCINYSYWVKIRLLVGNQTGELWMAEFYGRIIDRITACLPVRNGGYEEYQVGDFHVSAIVMRGIKDFYSK